ncbi:SufS family cysteine desulfurase [Streptomyces sp. NBC_00654]|uniref:SufS family cysteine desulfurase n=1 Tax=Streptomyces sp. NBC_00654 TaxID=2975799 RepID=UPI002B1E7201|nr:SufS family cysteine desulfurase [Streptomyces sp. NBC_00654]
MTIQHIETPGCLCTAHTALSSERPTAHGTGFDPQAVRPDFPVLRRTVNDGRPLIYLDSAATSQKPQLVLDAERDFYALHNANVHRSHHQLAREATWLLEAGRARIAAFVGARADDIVLTKNASEALNLVAYALGNASRSERDLRSLALGPGDRVVITEMEHHSNLMPWQQLCRRTGAELAWLTITPEGRLDLDRLDEIVDERTKVFAFTHQSNVYGTVNPVDVLVKRAREVGALTVLDACQSVPHFPVDVTELGVDFLAFSGHKMCGPTGIGVLWGRKELLRALPPFLTGGEMNDAVTMENSTYAAPPQRFEAGTPVIAQAVGLGAACTYLDRIGMREIARHGDRLTRHALDALGSVKGLRIVGPGDSTDRGPVISFALSDRFPDDIGEFLDARGIAIRVGHLCARPACVRFGLPATTRASFYAYTTTGEIDAFVQALAELAEPALHAVPETAVLPTAQEDSTPAEASFEPAGIPSTGVSAPAAAAEFLDRVLGDAATAATGLAVSLGDRLGLYRALSGSGPMSAAQLADRTGTHEIYVREWLHTQVGAGYVHRSPDTAEGQPVYLLPAAHAEVLADSDAPTAGVGIFASLRTLYDVEDRLAECFRTGEGVDWGEYPPQMFRAIARFFRPAYKANIVQKWLPELDGMTRRLDAGAQVADIGCGIGYSTLLMAQAFPRSAFHGFDNHQPSIDRARIIAEDRELDDRVRFHAAAARDLDAADAGRFDLITLFNCLHDMGDPLGALDGARRVLKPDGAIMLVEPNAEADPTHNTHSTGRLFMSLSTALCLPAAVAQRGPLALGNHAGEKALRSLAEAAGFTRWRRVAETPRSAVYEIRF